jgi:hypothetical protein
LLRQYNALQAPGRVTFIQNEYFVMAAGRRDIWRTDGRSGKSPFWTFSRYRALACKG